jgi:hypothetical protein
MLFRETVATFPENQSGRQMLIMITVTSGTPTKLLGSRVPAAATTVWDVAPYNPVVYRYFVGDYCLHLQG